jgi:hypothetical protein
MTNQYARVKNSVKGEDNIQDLPATNFGYIDEFHEVPIKSPNLDEEQGTDYLNSEKQNQLVKIIQ